MWPEVSEDELWLRAKSVGFTTVPRTITLIGRILDNLSDKGFPLSDTYLTLWCWVFDEAFLEVRNPRELAFESGFSGPRAETTWRNRMGRLRDLGFIKAREGVSGEFNYVLLLNPLKVIEKLYKEKERQHDVFYNALLSRLVQVGADDIQTEDEGDLAAHPAAPNLTDLLD
ncbi:hypothetical protein [Paraburkholderia bannensis]|uniref:hypothetical protein n=1 Tax=Paraburkholderia bannensis TaxID=765414 RepID=UPI0007C44F2F|nr:hypothetical protein [Paraburkholderia bannensis]